MFTTRTSANGGYGPTLLPRLGKLFSSAKFDVYLCGTCGHTAPQSSADTSPCSLLTPLWWREPRSAKVVMLKASSPGV